MRTKEFTNILEELGWPNIYLIPIDQFIHIEGYPNRASKRGDYGEASDFAPVVNIRTDMRGKERTNTIYHEILHPLFPNRPHWWIECAAERLARGGGRGQWSKKYGHTVDEMPSRQKLVELCRKASKRFNEQMD